MRKRAFSVTRRFLTRRSFGAIVLIIKAQDDSGHVWDHARSRSGLRHATGNGVREGEMAPDFRLAPPEDEPSVTLSTFRRILPVALKFGSYT